MFVLIDFTETVFILITCPLVRELFIINNFSKYLYYLNLDQYLKNERKETDKTQKIYIKDDSNARSWFMKNRKDFAWKKDERA